MTVFFVQSCTIETPRLDYVLQTASAMMSRQSHEPDIDMRYAASSFLDHLFSLIDVMNGDQAHSLLFPNSMHANFDIDGPSIDPEVASSGIALATKMIPRFLTCMLKAPNIEKIFDLSLRSLQAPDIMPKREAASFWVSSFADSWKKSLTAITGLFRPAARDVRR